jgi:hypothetical protein
MAKTGHPNFDYTCQALWRGNVHNFSITGNHSGTSYAAGPAQTFMEGDLSPMAKSFGPFMCPSIAIVEARYYDGQNSAPVWGATYDTDNPAPSIWGPSGLAYGADPATSYLPLEVCCMLEAHVGTSSTSKPVYCRKFMRGAPTSALGTSGLESVFNIASDGEVAAQAMGDGTWYGGRVYISPTAKQAIGEWEALSQVGNHQVPRGKKRKTAGSDNLQSAAEKLIALAGGIALAGA